MGAETGAGMALGSRAEKGDWVMAVKLGRLRRRSKHAHA